MRAGVLKKKTSKKGNATGRGAGVLRADIFVREGDLGGNNRGHLVMETQQP